MKQLNLLPRRMKGRQQAQRQQTAGLMGILVAVLLLGGAYVYLDQQEAQSTGDLSVVQSQLDSVLQDSGQDVRTDPAVQDAAVRISQANLISHSAVTWGPTLASAAKLVPAGLRLTTLSFTQTTSLAVLENGTAPSSAAFASFADTMSATKEISAFKINGYNYVAPAGAISFSLSYVIGPATPGTKAP